MGTGKIMSKHDEWVRVESEDELGPGMLIRGECFYGSGYFVLALGQRCICGHVDAGADCGRMGWQSRIVSGCCLDCDLAARWNGYRFCHVAGVREGRLFRLAVPPDEAALFDEKEASRRAAKVKERTR